MDGKGLFLLTREDIRDELLVESFVDRKRLWEEVSSLRARDSDRQQAKAAESTASSADLESQLGGSCTSARPTSTPVNTSFCAADPAAAHGERSPQALSRSLSGWSPPTLFAPMSPVSPATMGPPVTLLPQPAVVLPWE